MLFIIDKYHYVKECETNDSIQLCYIFKYQFESRNYVFKAGRYRQNREIISARGCNSSREILGIGFSSEGIGGRARFHLRDDLYLADFHLLRRSITASSTHLSTESNRIALIAAPISARPSTLLNSFKLHP